MICAVCGYIQADTERVCRRCGHIVATRKPASLARMESNPPPMSAEIPGTFPREVQSAGTVPAWRAELSARVRQVKARRMMESELEAARRDQRSSTERQTEPDAPPAKSTPVSEATLDEIPPGEVPSAAPLPDDLETIQNPLVRGALRRVRRAAESPRPLMSFPPRRASSLTQDVLTVTATSVTTTTAAPAPDSPQLDISEIASELDAALGDFDLLTETPATETMPSASRPVARPEPPPVPTAPVPPKRHLRRIRPLARERFLAGVIDSAVVALSCLPLLFVVVLTGTPLIHPGVAAVVACAAVLLAGMYLFGTVTVAGQTFGMMYLGLRVVSIYEDHDLNPVQVLLRTLGCGLSLLPLGAGFLWVLIDRDQRGWHEYLSATQLVREWYVETLPEA